MINTSNSWNFNNILFFYFFVPKNNCIALETTSADVTVLARSPVLAWERDGRLGEQTVQIGLMRVVGQLCPGAWSPPVTVTVTVSVSCFCSLLCGWMGGGGPIGRGTHEYLMIGLKLQLGHCVPWGEGPPFLPLD